MGGYCAGSAGAMASAPRISASGNCRNSIFSGKFGADGAAEGVALYMYTHKPERNARRMTTPTKPEKTSEEFFLTPVCKCLHADVLTNGEKTGT